MHNAHAALFMITYFQNFNPVPPFTLTYKLHYMTTDMVSISEGFWIKKMSHHPRFVQHQRYSNVPATYLTLCIV
jgi:hypothetical protein